MKQITFLIAVCLCPLLLFSQENKFEYTPKVKNRVEISNLLGKIDLKNTNGNTIVIESDFDLKKPERADGLQLLGAVQANTEIGVSVTEENGIVKIAGVSKKVKDFSYTISIPEGIAVNIDYHNPFAGNLIELSSYNGSVELKTLAADVKLTNCSGPFTVNSISGDIEAVLTTLNQDEPTSLASVSGLVDVTVPTGLKANIRLSNISGDIYNNLDLVPIKEKDEDKRAKGLDEIKHHSKGEYTLNGGGQKLLLKSISGNLYLRKK